MTLSFGGGAGVLTIPGVTSDGATPGGIIVAGTLQAGDPAATVLPLRSKFYGALLIQDTPANNSDFDDLLVIDQQAALGGGNDGSYALRIRRRGSLNGDEYQTPMFNLHDSSGTTTDLAVFSGTGGSITFGTAGGLGLFGATPPAAPRTLAQATITAITDANAKAAIQACANALSDMGVLTLT